MANIEIVEHTYDICIVGGGLAGCMAAIRAGELNESVVLIDKSNPERSGCAGAGIDHIFGYFPDVQKQEGISLDDMVEDHVNNLSKGLANKKMVRYILETSYDRILDLERYGAKIRYEDSTLPGKLRLQYQLHIARNTLHFDGRDIKRIMVNTVKKNGVDILDRVMITDLLMNDGKVAGAVGYGTRDGKLHVIHSKSVVMSCGRPNRLYRPLNGMTFAIRMAPSLTSDGKAAMFRAGAELINMEFLSIPGRWSSKNLIRGGGLPRGSFQPPGIGLNGKHEVIRPRTHELEDYGSKWQGDKATPWGTGKTYGGELDAGRGPIWADMSWGTEEDQEYMKWAVTHEGLGAAFLHIMDQYGLDFRKHKIETWPIEPEHSAGGACGPIVDETTQTTIPGLFAAGDEAGGVPGSTAPGAITMGHLSGESAVHYSKNISSIPTSKSEKEIEDFCNHILSRNEGDHWKDAQLTIHNIMSDYNVDRRSETMAARGLECLEYLKNTMKLSADNPHDMTHCLEMRSLIDTGQIIFRSTIERTESRPPQFKRLDCPEQDDANWFCFLGQRKEGDKIVFEKHKPS